MILTMIKSLSHVYKPIIRYSVDEDIIGLDPRYNLITPVDIVLGTYTKGYQGAKGVHTGAKLISQGFSGYGKRALFGATIDLYGFGSKTVNMVGHFSQSRSQDEKLGALAPSVKPKTLRGNSKPSRPTRSGEISKPFWSNGKPKCKKGFRYDFKRKLCVKIK